MDAHEKYMDALQRQKAARAELDLAISHGWNTTFLRQIWVDASRAADVARLNASEADERVARGRFYASPVVQQHNAAVSRSRGYGRPGF